MVDIERITLEYVTAEIEGEIDGIKEEFMDEFSSVIPIIDGSLSSRLTFSDDFENEIENHQYLKEYDDEDGFDSQIKIDLPCLDKFDYSNSLEILKFILEGVAGTYYELPEVYFDELKKGPDKNIINTVMLLPGVYSQEVPIENRFRLLQTSSRLYEEIQKIINVELKIFPYSNSEPIDIFDKPTNYVSENLPVWIKKGINNAVEEIQNV
jgi:hypothetical protein